MIPIILGLETATDACSVAIITPQQTFTQYVIAPQSHAKLVLDMVNEVCISADVALQDVHAFAYGQGPGSFTGLRIAASVVQGLAFGVGKPVIAISSLRALAQQAYNKLTTPRVLAMLDARMQEIYYGVYKVNQHGLMQTETPDSLQKPGILDVLDLANCVAVGTGVHAYAELLTTSNPDLVINPQILYPRAEEIVQLAVAEYLAGNILAPSAAIPTYVRNNVVQPGKKNPD